MKNKSKQKTVSAVKPYPEVRVIAPAQFIRQHILRISTLELGKRLGVVQSIVSRYYSFPVHHRPLIDKMAKDRGITIIPEWHTEVPFDPMVPRVARFHGR